MTVTNNPSGLMPSAAINDRTLKSISLVSLTGNTDLVAAIPGKVIKVYSFLVNAVSATTLTQFVSGPVEGSNTPLQGPQTWPSGGGYVRYLDPPGFFFCTAVGKGLGILTDGNISGDLSYWDSDSE